MFSYEKLPGLPRERILDVIAPVLRAHGLAGVELVWRTDGQGRLLYLTVESADAVTSGQGVTLDVCSRVSRDLSTAFDANGLFEGAYRLEVGSPGLDRRLYTLEDYRRFAGQLAKLKLEAPAPDGQSVLSVRLAGVDGEGRVLVADPSASAEGSDSAEARAVVFEEIRSGQLVVDWQGMGFAPAPRSKAGRRPAAQGRK
ncbi:MAG TPA: ribosome maturation factor RimP [Polyangiaceae bacterium]|nr:ribosome maturation factor RimP [Polyangiaceae bacterium]